MQVGEIINGRYKVVRQIGVGGMGAVYLVQDLELNSEVVAFKILHQQSDVDPEVFKRFRNEVLIARSLSHPGIVRTHDLGRAEGEIYYLTMEYVEGKTLKEVLKTSNFREADKKERLFKYYLDILAGVSYAHSKGVIHRDLKPANILISTNDEAKIGDFGTARSLELSEGLTKTGFSVGTPEYMSPEQIRGDALDHTCDIYSLGVLLYEIITGVKPFSADSPIGVAYKQLNEPLPTLEEKGFPGLQKLEEVIARCTKKNREDRYQSVAELIKDFKKAIVNSGELGQEGSSGNFNLQSERNQESDWSLGGEEKLDTRSIRRFRNTDSEKSLVPWFIACVLIGLGGSFFYLNYQPEEKLPEVPSLLDASAGEEEGIVEPIKPIFKKEEPVQVKSSPAKKIEIKPEEKNELEEKAEVVAKVEKKESPSPTTTATPTLTPTATSTPTVTPTPEPSPSPVVVTHQSFALEKFGIYSTDRADSIFSSVFSKQESIKVKVDIKLLEASVPFSSAEIQKRTTLIILDPKTGDVVDTIEPQVSKLSENLAQIVYKLNKTRVAMYPDFLRVDFKIDDKAVQGTFIKLRGAEQKESVPLVIPSQEAMLPSTIQQITPHLNLEPEVSEVPTQTPSEQVNLSGTIDILDPLNGIKEPHGMDLRLEKIKDAVSGTAKITGLGNFKVSGKYYERGVELDLSGDSDSLKLVGGKRDLGFKGTFISTRGTSSKGTWAAK